MIQWDLVAIVCVCVCVWERERVGRLHQLLSQSASLRMRNTLDTCILQYLVVFIKYKIDT